eukprot:7232289-Alexandrium_andersonii.AAC.1
MSACVLCHVCLRAPSPFRSVSLSVLPSFRACLRRFVSMRARVGEGVVVRVWHARGSKFHETGLGPGRWGVGGGGTGDQALGWFRKGPARVHTDTLTSTCVDARRTLTASGHGGRTDMSMRLRR